MRYSGEIPTGHAAFRQHDQERRQTCALNFDFDIDLLSVTPDTNPNPISDQGGQGSRCSPDCHRTLS